MPQDKVKLGPEPYYDKGNIKAIDMDTMVLCLMVLHKDKFNQLPSKLREIVCKSFIDALCRKSGCSPEDLKQEEKDWIQSICGSQTN